MYYIEKHSFVNRLDAVFQMFGLWQNENTTVLRKIRVYLFYLIFSIAFIMSLVSGALASNSKDESLFLGATALYSGVAVIRNNNIRWKREIILTFLRNNCTHSFVKESDFISVNSKLKKFLNFVTLFMLTIAVTEVFVFVVPAFTTNRALPINIGFPLNWKNNNFAYLLAYAFVIVAFMYNGVATFPNLLIWYLMINYSIKYENLGFKLRNMGVLIPTTCSTHKLSQPETRNLFHRDLCKLIQVHKEIQRNVDEFKTFFSLLFFVQIMTSAICICGPVYALTFKSYESLFEFAIYFVQTLYGIFEISMVMYFGNDIKLSSNRLLYCLFESNWIEQPTLTKKCLIILMERLKRPHELMIYSLYPLNLQTFTSIVRLAYSTFSILQNI